MSQMSLPRQPEKVEDLPSRSLGSGSLKKQRWINLSVHQGPEKGHHPRPFVLDGVSGSTGFQLAFEE